MYDLVYVRDLERVAGIAVLWEHRAPPTPLQPAAAVLGGLAPPTESDGTDVVKFLGLNPREVQPPGPRATAALAVHVGLNPSAHSL